MTYLKVFSVRILILFLLYTCLRVLFLALNFQAFKNLPVADILTAFAVGLRFDLAAICLVNGPLIFFSLLPGSFQNHPRYQSFLKYLFLVSNIPFLAVNAVDLEYFKVIAQRSTLTLVDMRADLARQIGQLAFNYWHVTWIAALVIFVLCYFHSGPYRLPIAPAKKPSALRTWGGGFIVMAALLPMSILGGRGGWQQKALTSAHAHVFDEPILSHLALNSTYTLLRSKHSCKALERFDFFASEADLRQQLSLRGAAAPLTIPRRDNIVIIIVESLSSEFMASSPTSYTPFLNSLAAHGVSFENNLANSRRTIDALAPILAGLPHLSDSTFSCSLTKELRGIGSLLKDHGYRTSFYHGGHNGSMFLDSFSRRMGFDRYYGENEYPNPADSDGIWGIYDEPFLQFVAQNLAQTKEPFASGIFTLTSHNPYKIPPSYRETIPKGQRPIHQSIGYVDLALRKFFAAAEQSSWYNNTLFIITGDHAELTLWKSHRFLDGYRVPLIFFHPGRELPKVDASRITQQMDILPSITDFLGIAQRERLPFGHSVFDGAANGIALGLSHGNYWLISGEFFLRYRLDGESKLFAPGRDPALRSPLTDRIDVQRRLEKQLQAYIQWFNNGLMDNRVYR